MSTSGKIYRFTLSAVGAFHALFGIAALTFMIGSGPYLYGYAFVLAIMLVGAVIGSRGLSPRFLRHPDGQLEGLGCLLALCVLGGASFLAGGYLGGMFEARGLENGIVYGMAPGGLLLGLMASFVLPVLIFMTAHNGGTVTQPDGAEAPSPAMTKARRDKLQAAQVKAAVAEAWPALGALPKLTARLHWLVLRLAGLLALAPAIYIAHWFFTDAPEGVGLVPEGRRAGKLVLVLVVGAIACAVPSRIGRSGAFFVPFRFRHWLAAGVLPAPLVAALLYLTLPAYPAIVPHPIAVDVALLRLEISLAVGACLLLLPLATLIMVPDLAAAMTEEPALRPYSASSAPSDMPAVAKKDIRRGALPEPKMPALGAAMKLYVTADWLVMRLLGLGLLGTGYLLWQMMEANRELPQRALSWGLEPLHALVGYAVVGALMAVPFLLPRFVVAPRHVLGGLIKAFLLVGTGFVLLPVVPTAVELLTDDKYHATLLAIAPIVFKSAMGVAVTGAILTSFFRQLGHAPKTDYLGKPMIELSQSELRNLRAARMGINT